MHYLNICTLKKIQTLQMSIEKNLIVALLCQSPQSRSFARGPPDHSG